MKNWITWSVFAALVIIQAPAQAATLGGLVLDERTGEPVSANLVLEIEQDCGSEYIFQYTDSVSTDENGAFSLTGLEAGNYQLKVNSTWPNDYLTEAYDSVSPYDVDNRTTISLGDDEERNDIVIELAKRPYLIEEVSWEPADFLTKGGRGKAIVTVMNTTNKSKRMNFWLTFDLNRLEAGRFDNTDSIIPAKITHDRPHTLAPGLNTVSLEVKLPKGIGERGHLDYSISAGNDPWQPLMPAWRTMPTMRIIVHSYIACFDPAPIIWTAPIMTLPAQPSEGSTTWGSVSSWTIAPTPLDGSDETVQE